MKKITSIIFIAAVLYFAGCTAAPGRMSILTPDNAMMAVSKFVVTMRADGVPESELLGMLSDSLMRERKLDKNTLKVNKYYYDDMNVESAIPDPSSPAGMVVSVKINGVKDVWIHRLYFKVIEEGDRLKLIPGTVLNGYVDPWVRIDEFIKE